MVLFKGLAKVEVIADIGNAIETLAEKFLADEGRGLMQSSSREREYLFMYESVPVSNVRPTGNVELLS